MARYRIDPERSHVVIDASSSLHPIHSKASGLEGWLDLAVEDGGGIDPTAPSAAHLELPVRRLRSGNPLEERELKRRIDARRHPTISGELTSIEATAEAGRYVVRGDVTFRGTTLPMTDEVTISDGEGDAELRVQGTSTFDIREFGMEPPKILLLRVHPEVTVTIDLVAVREG